MKRQGTPWAVFVPFALVYIAVLLVSTSRGYTEVD